MQPVIPRIQAGDILKSTRHLRQWLQLVSRMLRLEDIAGGKPEPIKLCAPSKEDPYITIVNRQPIFAVWSPTTQVVLTFQPGRQLPGRKSKFLANNPGISPRNFAHWFIRTPERNVDTLQWDNYAYAMWVVMHQRAFTELPPWAACGPFNYRRTFLFSKTNLGSIQAWRSSFQKLGTGHRRQADILKELEPQGPQLTDYVRFRDRIHELMQHPRVTAYFSRGKNEELSEYQKEIA